MRSKIGSVVLSLALGLVVAPAMRATTIPTLYACCTTENDNSANTPILAFVNFSIVGSTMTVSVTNALPDLFDDAQIITTLSFQASNNGGVTFLSAGNPATVTDAGASVLNKVGTASSFIGTGGCGGTNCVSTNTAPTVATNDVTWFVTNAGAGGKSASGITVGTNAFILSAQSGKITSGLNGVIGLPNGSGAYDGQDASEVCPGTGGKPCNTAFPIANGKLNSSTVAEDTDQFIYHTATFSFTFTGLTSTTAISNVFIGFGPDGPDSDDWVQAIVPEPATLGLVGLSLLGLGGLHFRRKKRSLAPPDGMKESATPPSETSGLAG